MATPPPPTPPSGGSNNSTSNGTDSSGNQIVSVGSVQVSINPQVNFNSTVVNTGHPVQQTIPSENSAGGISSTANGRPQTVMVDKTMVQVIQEAASWTATQKSQFIDQAKAAGLISTTHPSFAEVAQAWSLVVQEAVLQGKNPVALMQDAAKSGWQGIHPTLQPADAGLTGSGESAANGQQNTTTNTSADQTTNTQSQQTMSSRTSYISYMDPATVVGAINDAWYRLDGKLPPQNVQRAFLNSVYQYEDQANTGRFEQGVILKDNQKIDQSTGQVVDTKTGKPVSESDIQRVGTNNVQDTGNTTEVKNIVSQRSIGQRGLELLAGNAAMADPGFGQYQASTTYFNALIKALSAPAAGMGNSGPTTTAP